MVIVNDADGICLICTVSRKCIVCVLVLCTGDTSECNEVAGSND